MHFHVVVVQKRAKKCTKKRDARAIYCFVYKTYCFLTFSLSSVSLDLKVSTIFLRYNFLDTLSTVEPRSMDARLIQTPVYSGQFHLSPRKKKVMFSLKLTRSIRTPWHVPSLSISTGFYCINSESQERNIL